MVLDGDLQFIIDTFGESAERQRVGDFQEIDARFGEREAEEIVRRGRTAAGANARIRPAGAPDERIAGVIVELQDAAPPDQVAGLESAVDLEDSLNEVLAVRVSIRKHLGRDGELVEVVLTVSGGLNRNVRLFGRLQNVGVVVPVPLAHIDILGREPRIVRRVGFAQY